MIGHRAQRAATIEGAPTMAARLRMATLFVPLDRIAHKVLADRNAKGAPERLRARLRAAMRPTLRDALEHAIAARAALFAGDLAAYEGELGRAHLALTMAQVEFRQPFMDSYRVQAEAGRRGGRPRKADQAAEWSRRYERMERTHRTLTAQERYEQIASDDLGTDAKWRTVRNAISEYRKRQK